MSKLPQTAAALGSPATERAEHRRLMDLALGDLVGRHGEKLCGRVLVPGEARARYLYRMPDGIHVAGAPVPETRTVPTGLPTESRGEEVMG